MLVGLPQRHLMKALGRVVSAVAAPIFAASAAGVCLPALSVAQAQLNSDVAALARLPIVDSSSLRTHVAHLSGKSGKLLAAFVAPPRTTTVSLFTKSISPSKNITYSKTILYTTKAIPQIQEVTGASHIGRFSLITMKSFADKISGWVNGYHVGFWPEEKGRLRSAAYENPDGFIEVTPQNQDMRISEHFRLRDFLTHDQQEVWPKYMVLQEPLVDKLELVIQDLEAHGIPASQMRVLSGFRTPQYNLALGDESGRARDSRHQFGDAADVYIDANGDGRMDDLNRDGRVNFRDTRVILAAVERIERLYPDLVGGVGLYHSSGPHGPFAHIDVRGSRARWVKGARLARSRHKSRSKGPKSRVAASGSSHSGGKGGGSP
jgi:uncharacterized protein YcbK (DUF882 family)